jgi:DNA-binding NarL/FixJ family response regulator
MNRTRIMVGDDHSLILEGIRALIDSKYDVVGSATDGKQLVSEALRLQPEIVVLDISMPIINGIDAAREIRKSLAETRFVFVSMHSNAIYVRKAMEAGGAAYVLKSGSWEELLDAIEMVRKGGIYLSPSLGNEVIDDVKARRSTSSPQGLDLTSRQRQILQLIAEGKQNKEIAAVLHVSVRTVEFHRSRLMSRLGARTAAELSRFALNEGLIGPER